MTLAAARLGRTIGATIEAVPEGLPLYAWLFGEDQGRYLVTAPAANAEAILRDAKAKGVPARRIGTTGGAALTLKGGDAISVQQLSEAHEGWLPRYMAGP
jgi:phosphoribosylformylglycinamidine synthase